MLDYVLANEEWLYIGTCSAILALIFRLFMKRRDVYAKNRSVAVGGNNSGTINNIHTTPTTDEKKANTIFWDAWNIVCGIVTLVGFVLTVIAFWKTS